MGNGGSSGFGFDSIDDVLLLPGSDPADAIFGLGGTTSTDPMGQIAAAEAQQEAQKAALDAILAESGATRAANEAAIDEGQGYIQQYGQQAGQSLADMYAQTQGYYQQAGGQYGQAMGQAQGALGSGYYTARGDLAGAAALAGRYEGGATRSINPYDVTGQQSRLEGMLGRGDQLSQRIDQGVNLQEDPGYQFRLQQGEQALNRSAAARGGRLGGAQLKALSEYGQGMASQEYGAAFQRKQQQDAAQMGLYGQQMGAAGSVDQMRQQALLNQAGRSDAAALQAQQNQMALAGRGYDAQSNLANLAYQYGQGSANLYGQQGQGMANILGQQAGASQQQGQSLADLYTGLGQGMSGMSVAGMAANTQLASGIMDAYANYANVGGSAEQAKANQNMGILGILAQIFSDQRVKSDIAEGADAAQKMLRELRPYTFRYKSQEYGNGHLLGVMAQDLERSEMGREMVVKTPEGIRMIDPVRAISALLGTVAHLNSKIEALTSEVATLKGAR